MMKECNGMKRCPKCGHTKEVAQFYRNYATADGYQVWCKDCFKAVRSANRERHLGSKAADNG